MVLRPGYGFIDINERGESIHKIQMGTKSQEAVLNDVRCPLICQIEFAFAIFHAMLLQVSALWLQLKQKKAIVTSGLLSVSRKLFYLR